MVLIGEVVELRSGALLEEVGHWGRDAFPHRSLDSPFPGLQLILEMPPLIFHHTLNPLLPFFSHN